MIKVLNEKIDVKVFKFFVNGGRETLIYEGDILGFSKDGFLFVNDKFSGVIELNPSLIASKIPIKKIDIKRVDK